VLGDHHQGDFLKNCITGSSHAKSADDHKMVVIIGRTQLKLTTIGYQEKALG